MGVGWSLRSEVPQAPKNNIRGPERSGLGQVLYRQIQGTVRERQNATGMFSLKLYLDCWPLLTFVTRVIYHMFYIFLGQNGQS